MRFHHVRHAVIAVAFGHLAAISAPARPDSASVQAVPVPCPGDLNADGVRDTADLIRFLPAFGTCPGDENYRPLANLAEADPCINTVDLVGFLGRFGRACPSGEGPLFPARQFDTGTGPTDVSLADLDGDGDLDLGVANYTADNVS